LFGIKHAKRCAPYSAFDAFSQHEDKGFAHPEKIQKLVKNYSQFVSFPIYTWQEKGHTKEVNNYFALILINFVSPYLLILLAICSR
jgi:HSP90 family molecular chaperone